MEGQWGSGTSVVGIWEESARGLARPWRTSGGLVEGWQVLEQSGTGRIRVEPPTSDSTQIRGGGILGGNPPQDPQVAIQAKTKKFPKALLG